MSKYYHNPEFIHHNNSKFLPYMRDTVFGVEDGMVSTLGAVTGIAAATGDQFVVILSGFVVIAVESISMGVGSYISSKSVKDVEKRKILEEKQEVYLYPVQEIQELCEIYIQDGWPKDFAAEMARVAGQNKKLLLHEMKYHELEIPNDTKESSIKNGLVMFVSYVIGGSIPLIAFLVVPVWTALPISIGITLVGLFVLGAFTTRFTKRAWWRAGLEMLLLASAAALVGYGVGQLVDTIFF